MIRLLLSTGSSLHTQVRLLVVVMQVDGAGAGPPAGGGGAPPAPPAAAGPGQGGALERDQHHRAQLHGLQR